MPKEYMSSDVDIIKLHELHEEVINDPHSSKIIKAHLRCVTCTNRYSGGA